MAEKLESSESMQPAAGYESVFERISTRGRIGELLQRLAAQRANVTVAIPGEAKRYSSSFLALTDVTGIVLDELNPAEGHAALLQQRKLRVIAHLNGATLHFSTGVIAVGEQAGIAYYHLAAPELINYRQRRKSFRVPVDGRYAVPVTLDDGQQRLNCDLLDISAEGIALCLLPQDASEVERLQQFSSCMVRLPNHESIQCSVEVRNIRHDAATSRLIVGGRFVAQNARDHDQLAKIVTAFERFAIRQRRQRST